MRDGKASRYSKSASWRRKEIAMSDEKPVIVYEGPRIMVCLDGKGNLTVRPMADLQSMVRISFCDFHERKSIMTIEPVCAADLCDRDRTVRLQAVDVVPWG